MRIHSIKPVLMATVMVLAALVSSGAQATDFTVPMSMNSRGLMIGGYDPVAYIDYEEATPGFPDIHYDYRKTFRFHFASKVTMKKFMGDPDRFIPAYGGHCAWIMASGKDGAGDLYRSDPTLFRVVDGRVYLFSSAEALEEWSQDEAGNLARANANWDALVASRQKPQ